MPENITHTGQQRRRACFTHGERQLFIVLRSRQLGQGRGTIELIKNAIGCWPDLQTADKFFALFQALDNGVLIDAKIFGLAHSLSPCFIRSFLLNYLWHCATWLACDQGIKKNARGL